jgi:hypothetical protein
VIQDTLSWLGGGGGEEKSREEEVGGGRGGRAGCRWMARWAEGGWRQKRREKGKKRREGEGYLDIPIDLCYKISHAPTSEGRTQ